MLINVTQDDIDKGEPCRAFCCPIALAIERQTKALPESVVVYRQITIGSKFIMDSPPEVLNFIDKFDDGKNVEPFSFELPYGKEKTK
jgi:hypothetical protein